MTARAMGAVFGAFVAFVAATGAAIAGPPYLTDDPELVPLHDAEFYVLWTNDDAPISEITQIPGFEFNYGFARHAYAHIAVAHATFEPPNGPVIGGNADTELGVKVQLFDETTRRPQLAFYPMAELATGTSGISNGTTWYKLPLWIEKTAGPWTIYGGGGIAINPAAGQKNFGFGGIVVERDLGSHLTLGVETFSQGATDAANRATSYADLGATWKPTEHVNVLVSAGHSYTGNSHAIGYAALYFTTGPTAQ